MRTIWVHCYQASTLLRSYDFGISRTTNDAALHQPTTREAFKRESKTNLTNKRLARPLDRGISFKIDHPR